MRRSDLKVGISSATILDIRKTKCQFLESLNGRGGHTHQASQALGSLGYIDVEEDEYSEEVGWELMLLFHQLVAHCRDPGVTLEVIRRIKSITDRYHQQMDRSRVQLLCDVIKVATYDVSSSRMSRVMQSGLALLTDVSRHPSLKLKNLQHLPQQLVRKMRNREEVDGDQPVLSQTKKLRLSEEEEKEEEEEEKYLQLMEELMDTTDGEKAMDIEKQLEDMGYTAYVH